MKNMNIHKFKRGITPWLFLTPAFIVFGLYSFYPVFYAMYMSLFDWGNLVETTFIGFRNYVSLFNDTLFRISIINTLVYTSAVPFKVVLALLLATLLNQRVRGETLYRAVMFFPFAISGVIIGIIWNTMWAPNFGFINAALTRIGLEGQRWLIQPEMAMVVVIIVSVWAGLGANLIIFVAGIKGIPREYYEAASIDGASGFKAFRFITLPCLRPTTVFVTTMAFIGSFRIFDLVYIMTGGGPGNATTTMVQFIYIVSFTRFRFGYASAAAMIFFIMLFTLTLMQRRILSRVD